jgi:hypothetical protein
MTNVWAHSRSEGSARLILLAIADFADDKGRAYPSVGTLAQKARVSERTAQYAIAELVSLGELVISKNTGPRGCNVYGVQNLHRCKEEQGGVQNTTEGGATVCTRTVIEPSGNRNTPLPPKGGKRRFPKPLTIKGPMQLRAERLMRRKESTPLNKKERRAFAAAKQAIMATTEDQWQALERFYDAPQAETFARKDLVTLLNNWNGEIDRALRWSPNAKPKSFEPALRYV